MSEDPVGRVNRERVAEISLRRVEDVRRALQVLESSHREIVLVCDDEGRLLGTVTDGDIRRATLSGTQLSEQVERVMNRSPVVGANDMSSRELLQLMNARGVNQLPLVDAVGVVVDVVLLSELAQALEPMIPLIELPISERESKAVQAVLQSGWLTMGDVTGELEREFADFVGAEHAVAVNSGTAALHLAHRALGIGPGDEVICPSLSFVATANAILYVGATPVFVDVVGSCDLTLDPPAVEAAITPRTRGIVAMHYGGNPCDMEALTSIANQRGLFMIEDAAHAPGAATGGRMCGAWGDIGCFSFYSNKNLTTGEGGMATTHSADLAERMRLLRSHGMTASAVERHRGSASAYDVVDLGYNYRLDEMRAALGLEQLRGLADRNARRRQLAGKYLERLGDCEGLELPFGAANLAESACHLFPVLLDRGIDRDEVAEILRAEGVQSSVHYPAIHQLQYYRERFQYSLPKTEDIAAREITLPMFASMSEEQVDRVARCLRSAVSSVVQLV